MKIYTVRPKKNWACFKMENRRKQLSICCDDSCGALLHLERCDIACFLDGNDITEEIFGRVPQIRADEETFDIAYRWLTNKED